MNAEPPTVSRSDALRVWIRVAIQSFGGPAGQIAVLHRIIVDEKKWLTETRFLHALSYCMLLPGPEAQQLATYMGWLLHGVRGGLVAGLLFIAPGFLSILALSLLYAGYNDAPIVAGIFFGLKPAVVAIVFEAVARLRHRALTGTMDVALAAAAFAAIFIFQIAFPFIVAGAAVVGFSLQRMGEPTSPGEPDDVVSTRLPSFVAAGRTAFVWLIIWLVPLGVLSVVLGGHNVLVNEGVFFSKVAVVTFGGAYAVLSYVAQEAVNTLHWLGPTEMLDGLGMAETTPGPLIQVVQFVGFMGAYRTMVGLDPMIAGIAGSVVTTWVTFAPCFLFIFVGAPFVEHLRGNRVLNSALRGITAAVVGVVFNLAIWFSLHTLFGEVQSWRFGFGEVLVPVLNTLDWKAAAIAAGAFLAIFRFKIGTLTTLGAAAIAGLALKTIV